MAGLAGFREKYPQYDDIPDAELADSLHAKFYSDIPKDEYLRSIGLAKPSGLLDRIKSALTPDPNRAPMPSTADTINNPTGEFDTGATAAPEGAISLPGSVMDGYVPTENTKAMPIDRGMGPMRESYYDETRAGLLSAPVQTHAAAAQGGGQVGKVAAATLPERVGRLERQAQGDTVPRTQQDLEDDTGGGLLAQPLRTEAAKQANREWLTENSAAAVAGIRRYTNMSQADAEAELAQMVKYGVKPGWVDGSMPDATLAQAASANLAATGPALQKALIGLSEAAADQPFLQLPWVEYANRTPRELDAIVGDLDQKIRAARNVGGKIEAGSWNDVVSSMGPSLATNLPPLIAAALVSARNPAAGMAIANGGLGVMGLQKFGDNYLKGQMKGLSPADNLTQASLGAAAEIIPEKLSLNALFSVFKTMGKGAAVETIKAFAKQQLTEHTTEQITTIADHLIDKAYTEPDKSLESLWEDMKQTGMATAIQGPILAGGGMVAHSAGRVAESAAQRIAGANDLTAGMQFNPAAIDAAARQSLDPSRAQLRQTGGLLSAPVAPRATAADVATAPTPQAAAAAITDMGAGIAGPVTEALSATQAEIDALLSAPIESASPLAQTPIQATVPPSVVAQPEPVVADPPGLLTQPAASLDSYLTQNSSGRWQLARPIDDADTRAAVIDELDRRNNQGTANAQDQAQQGAPALQDVPQAAPEAGALPDQLTPDTQQAPAKRREESQQERSEREFAENYDRVQQDIPGSSTKDLYRAVIFADKAIQSLNLKAQRGEPYNVALRDSLIGERDYLKSEWEKRTDRFEQPAVKAGAAGAAQQTPEASRPNPVDERQANVDSIDTSPERVENSAKIEHVAPERTITRIKGGKLDISGFSREDVAGTIRGVNDALRAAAEKKAKKAGLGDDGIAAEVEKSKIRTVVTVGNDGRVLVSATDRAGNPAPITIKQQNAINKALMGAKAGPKKPRKFTGNLRNDVNLIAPGLYAEVARGGDGEGMEGIDMSLVAERLRDEGFMLPTTETGKDSDAVIELIRQDIANGGGTLNEARQTAAMTEAEQKAHRLDVLRLADEYGIETKRGIIPRRLEEIETDLEAVIADEIGIAGKSMAAARDAAIEAGIPADEIDAILGQIADFHDTETSRDKYVLMYREQANALQEAIDGYQGREGRDAQGEGAGNDLPPPQGGEERPAFDLAGQSAEEIRADEERIAAAEAQAREEETRAAAAERQARIDAEVASRQDVAADNFTLDAQVNDQAAQRAADRKRADDQLAGQGDIFGSPIDAAAHEAATSPKNDKPAPTPAQIEAGNYASLSLDDYIKAARRQYPWKNEATQEELKLEHDEWIAADREERGIASGNPLANVVIRDVRSGNGAKLGDLIEPYDGTKEGALAAAKRLEDRFSGYQDASNIQSRIGATDENGQPKWAISPNLQNINPVDTVKGRATFGDMDAIRQAYVTKYGKEPDEPLTDEEFRAANPQLEKKQSTAAPQAELPDEVRTTRLTIDSVPPARLKKITVAVDALVGDQVQKMDVPAKQALADINEEIRAYELLLACVKG